MYAPVEKKFFGDVMVEGNNNEHLDELGGETKSFEQGATPNLRLAEMELRFEQRIRLVKLSVLVVLLVVAMIAMIAVTSKLFSWRDRSETVSRGFDASGLVKYITEDQFDELKESSAKNEDIIDRAIKLIGTPANPNADAAQILALESLKSSVRSLDDRLAVIERSISDNPEKALSIPMLRKDQENMAKAIESSRAVMTTELARIYDQQKWMLGGVGTVLFAVITALVTALFKIFFKSREE
jgi:hypothetical protein